MRRSDYESRFGECSGLAFGSVAFGSVAFGSVAFGSVAFGSVAFGSVAFGSVAFGSVAFGSVAFGSVDLSAWCWSSRLGLVNVLRGALSIWIREVRVGEA